MSTLTLISGFSEELTDQRDTEQGLGAGERARYNSKFGKNNYVISKEN